MSGGLYLLTVGVLQPAVCMNVGSQLVVLHWWSTTLAINGLDDCLVRDRAIPLAQDHVTHVNKGVFSERGRLFSVGGPVVRTARDSSVRVLLRMVRLNPRSIVE